TVEKNRDPAANRIRYRGQRIEGCDRPVDLTSAMIGDHDAIDAVLNGEPRIVPVQYAFQKYRKLRAVSKKRQITPGQAGIRIDFYKFRGCPKRILLGRPCEHRPEDRV